MKHALSLLTRRPLVLALCALSYAAAATVLVALGARGLLLATLLLLLFPTLELLLRAALCVTYGRHYRYALLNYFLVDHPRYGYAFRSSADSAAVGFSLFDKFLFPAGVAPSAEHAENRAARVRYRVNSLGFRGAEFFPRKQPGVIRIFASGGSTTAGHRVNNEEAWPAALERELRAAGIPAEVINAGVQGWNSYQELLRFQEEIVRYEPDVVLLHQGWNEEFDYSCRNLGRWWRPRVVRNLVEDRYLYSGRQPLLSQTRSLFLFFAVELYFKNFVFNRNMSFTNSARWECLAACAYLEAWFDNLADFAREAAARNILLYAIRYPSLVTMGDAAADRETYVARTRLTPLFASYQALSKARVDRVLHAAEAFLPCLDAERDFASFRGEERAALFLDDIHLSARGNELLAEGVGKRLREDGDFQALARAGAVAKSNATFEEETFRTLREAVGENNAAVSRFLDDMARKLSAGPRAERAGVPTDRYTTY